MASPADIFQKLTEELSSLLEKEGLAVRPYTSPQLPFFHQLSEKQQLETISGLRHYLEAAKRVVHTGGSLKDAKQFVTTALQYFGFQPHAEFAERAFKPDVVTEFYSLAGTQLFRTFNFFEMTSYTLEDLYCRQWVSLYERPGNFLENMFEQVEELLKSGDIHKSLSFGKHTIKERMSLEKLAVECDGVHVSLATKKNQVAGIMSLVTCRPLKVN